MVAYSAHMPEKPTSLMGLPPEIVEQIIAKLDAGSPNFLLDFLNVLLALDISSDYNKQCFRSIVEGSRSQIAVVDFTNPDDRFTTPVLSLLRNYFTIDLTERINQAILMHQPREEQEESQEPQESQESQEPVELTVYPRIVLVIDDSLTAEQLTFQQFRQLYSTLKNADTVIDIVCCPPVPVSTGPTRNFASVSVVNVLKHFDDLFFFFNSLIMEFSQSSIIVSRNFFEIMDARLLRGSWDGMMSHYTARCKQVSFPSLIELHMDYLTIDSCIYKTLEYAQKSNIGNQISRNLNRWCADNMMSGFMETCEFYYPNLKKLKFFNYNNEETCNFIDLSTPMIKKLDDNCCPLKTIFALHSFKNWNMPNLEYFTGHRFKYDESKMAGSTERLKRSLRKNILYLHDKAMRETSDATPYFRVSLIPKGVKFSKVLNWLPSHSPNSFRQTRLNMAQNNRYESSVADDDDDDYYDSSNHGAAPSDVSERKKNQSYFNKPILCFKNESLEKLELQLLTLDKNNKSIYIQGLFLPKLKERVIQNYTSVTKRARISDKQNTIVMLSPTSSNQNRLSPVSSTHTSDGLTNSADMDDIYPLGFSVWNNLTAVSLIRFTSHQNILSDKIQPLDMVDKKQINFLFKINNLKENLPRLNLADSFENFFDERQRYIIV